MRRWRSAGRRHSRAWSELAPSARVRRADRRSPSRGSVSRLPRFARCLSTSDRRGLRLRAAVHAVHPRRSWKSSPCATLDTLGSRRPAGHRVSCRSVASSRSPSPGPIAERLSRGQATYVNGREWKCAGWLCTATHRSAACCIRTWAGARRGPTCSVDQPTPRTGRSSHNSTVNRARHTVEPRNTPIRLASSRRSPSIPAYPAIACAVARAGERPERRAMPFPRCRDGRAAPQTARGVRHRQPVAGR
jgi:hypothetical protein